MRPGVRIGVDVGQVRVGLARTDPEPFLAFPIETHVRPSDDSDWGSVSKRVAECVNEFSAVEVIVGLPLNMRGESTASTRLALECAAHIAQLVHPVPVRTVDERLSTVSAASALHESGKSARQQKALIDQQAAVLILQQALDLEKQSGLPPGSQISAKSQ